MNAGSLAAGLGALTLRILGPAHASSNESDVDRLFTRAFFASNLAVLVFCVAAILNARATFSIETETFTYRDGVVSWLPTTYDRDKSVQFLINALGLFSFFWSLRLWVMGIGTDSAGPTSERRLRLVLWVFVANGFLVALQGLLQRLSGSPNLLWTRASYWNDAYTCFGPFSYRGNAADYLNLVWPVSFGLWYTLARRRHERRFGFGDGPELMLFPISLITGAASFATLSRGGALTAGAMLLTLLAFSFGARGSRWLKVSLAVSATAIMVTAAVVSGSSLAERFRAALTDNLSGRTEIYENAHKIARDFPWFGAGPGAFMSVYQLYRSDVQQSWAAFVHDDWLETRVTFGRIGTGLVLLQLVLLVFWTIANRKQWQFPALTFSLLVSIGGCLAHAKRDFPFQTYGVFFTFAAVCALLTAAASRKKSTPHSDFD